jgi:hypothetical protein
MRRFLAQMIVAIVLDKLYPLNDDQDFDDP